MSLRLFDFKCPNCGHAFEALVGPEDREEQCPSCAHLARRQVSRPRLSYLKMGVDPTGLPTAGDKWAKMHEQRAKVEHKQHYG